MKVLKVNISSALLQSFATAKKCGVPCDGNPNCLAH